MKKHILSVHTKDCLWKCDKCDKVFEISSRLGQHIRRKHEQVRVECEVCHQKITSHNLKAHKMIHDDSNKIKCDLYDKEIVTSYLFDHKNRVHSDKKINCKECNKYFFDESSLKDHVNIVHSK